MKSERTKLPQCGKGPKWVAAAGLGGGRWPAFIPLFGPSHVLLIGPFYRVLISPFLQNADWCIYNLLARHRALIGAFTLLSLDRKVLQVPTPPRSQLASLLNETTEKCGKMNVTQSDYARYVFLSKNSLLK